MNPKVTWIVPALLILVFMVSCARPENLDLCVNVGSERGFWYGLLHGFLAPVTFIISLLSDGVTMYDVNNNGGWYDFGFLIGIGGFSGGIFKSSSRKKK